MTALTIYLVGILHSVHVCLNFFVAVAVIAAVGMGACVFASNCQIGCNEVPKPLVKWFKRFTGLAIVLMLFKTFLPDTKLMAAMYIIPAVVNNEKVANIGDNLLETFRGLTEKWMLNIIQDKPSNSNGEKSNASRPSKQI